MKLFFHSCFLTNPLDKLYIKIRTIARKIFNFPLDYIIILIYNMLIFLGRNGLKMGIFDGYLLMSDIDGTFEHASSFPAPQKNVDAISYFIRNGGRFAFATGRMSGHLFQRGFDKLVNAPVCLCNGGAVYDLQKNSVLYVKKLGHTVSELAAMIRGADIQPLRFMAPCGTVHMDSPIDIINVPEELKDRHPIKAVAAFETAGQADVFYDCITAFSELSDCYICKSWDKGVEILGKNATKGEAIDYVKELTGCHTSVGIGDHGNDIPLIKHADIGAAVANASDELKACADITVCDCNDCAIADLIYKLEQKIKNGA